jgi:tryptophan synthase alpha chain
MNPIDRMWQELRRQGRKALIPFLPAGDPDLAGTTNLVSSLAQQRADIIEIGFPYSDPIADGPVIQSSYTRALGRGVRVDDIFETIRVLTRSSPFQEHPVPLVAMVSYALVLRRGPAAFLDQSEAAGFSGAIVPDLPIEEAGELAEMAKARDFKFIQLITPTTPPERALHIAQLSTGFLYCVSVAGITGARDHLPKELLNQLAWLRTHTDQPICVGFGISKVEHVQMLREVADGIIVGSTLVRHLAEVKNGSVEDVSRQISEVVNTLAEALNSAGAKCESADRNRG